MSHTICLDGTDLELDVDQVEVSLAIPGLAEIPAESAGTQCLCCEAGTVKEPVAQFADGTTVYFHCAPEGEPDRRCFSVASPKPHRWRLEFVKDAREDKAIVHLCAA